MSSTALPSKGYSTSTSSEQRYLIAQYAADPRRMETRNIGVVLWAEGRAEARFLGDNDAAEFVNDLATYRRWVSFWHTRVYGQEITVPGEPPVSKQEPAFVDALLRTQKGNYLLFDAGFVAEPIEQEDIGAAAAFLFDELVALKKSRSLAAEHDNLSTVANRAFEVAGIASRSDFIASYRVSCKVFGVEQDLVFNYALAEDEAQAVFQRVPLRQQAIFGTATMFNCLVDCKKVPSKKRCVSLIDVPDEQRQKPGLAKFIRTLRKVSGVVDLSDQGKAAEQIKHVAEAA
jgi:hypothetical protein